MRRLQEAASKKRQQEQEDLKKQQEEEQKKKNFDQITKQTESQESEDYEYTYEDGG